MTPDCLQAYHPSKASCQKQIMHHQKPKLDPNINRYGNKHDWTQTYLPCQVQNTVCSLLDSAEFRCTQGCMHWIVLHHAGRKLSFYRYLSSTSPCCSMSSIMIRACLYPAGILACQRQDRAVHNRIQQHHQGTCQVHAKILQNREVLCHQEMLHVTAGGTCHLVCQG